jgi:ubiquinone/menaquinone biosynthesis C-methylase UbiE
MVTARAPRRRHWYPRAKSEMQPSPWWYFGRAVYVSRRDYGKIFLVFIAVGIPLGVAGLIGRLPALFWAAVALAALGLLMLLYSLVGLYRMYGHPAAGYLRKLLQLGDVRGPVVVADVHIGTYRHSYALAALLPEATIYSIDCWDEEGRPNELAIQDVRDLEPPPSSEPQIIALRAPNRAIPLGDHSCDVVVLGFGTHEISTGGPRETLFAEAERILKRGGKALLFEHGFDLHNYLIFGPVIHHVTRRRDWEAILARHFEDVRHARTSHAVDLFVGRCRG